MATLADLSQAERLLDFNQKLDIDLLDAVVTVMNTETGAKQQTAQKLLTELKQNPDAWTRVDAILQYSNNLATKYFGLQILEGVIASRWKVLPREQCDGIKNFIVQQIIDLSSDPQKSQTQNMYLNKLNLVLVQIVKKEWPTNWPTFLSDIVGSSHSSESICMNNMRILKLLSEEVFDFSSEQMTSTRAGKLKEQFCTEFQAVFELCTKVMETTENAQLVEATLETLLRFLNWIPVGYIFETDLIKNLVMKFLPVPAFRNVTTMCLVEIAGVPINCGHLDGRLPESNQKYAETLISLFMTAIDQLNNLIPENVDLSEAYSKGADSDQKFISILAQFLVTFLKEHSDLVEQEEGNATHAITPVNSATIMKAHTTALNYLLRISRVDDVEVFKICLEYWLWLTGELYRTNPFHLFQFPFGGGITNASQPHLNRLRIYQPTLGDLRYIMISTMAKPEEVLVVENEQGEVVRETIKNTDNLALYQTMRETLVYLTNLDPVDTERIMTEKLQRQVDGTEWSWKNLNTLCWAIGSISGAMQQEDEKRFLVTVIRDLLGLCEAKRGKDNKAVIASNIMYVVGQYPRFLREHWKFLKTVVNKLFEFMHEPHEGVQDMAVETFQKITDKCRRHFVQMQAGESSPFIDEILANLTSTICDLTQPQVHVFYEAVGKIISFERNPGMESDNQSKHIDRLMQLPNSVWDEIMQNAGQNVDILRDPTVVRQLANIMKTNVAVCRTIGQPFLQQLIRIYMDMLNVYKVTSENISSVVATHGEQVISQPLIKSMRGLKTDTLMLISCWVEQSNQEDAPMILENCVPPLFEAVLFDYQRNVTGARESEVLHTITVFINKLKVALAPEIERILNAVFECTLEMINKDMHEWPEHRTQFFQLLRAITESCTPGLVQVRESHFQLYMDSLVWGMKHTMRNVAEIALETIKRLFEAMIVFDDQAVARQFYKRFLVGTLVHVLSVVSDSSQSQVVGLTYYAEIIGLLCRIVESPRIMPEPLGDNSNNMEYVATVIGQNYKEGFPHLTDDQIRVTIKGFFSFDDDVVKLKEHLRNFLVQVKEFAGADTTDLFIEETEREMQEAQHRKLAVPGMDWLAHMAGPK